MFGHMEKVGSPWDPLGRMGEARTRAAGQGRVEEVDSSSGSGFVLSHSHTPLTDQG